MHLCSALTFSYTFDANAGSGVDIYVVGELFKLYNNFRTKSDFLPDTGGSIFEIRVSASALTFQSNKVFLPPT